MIAHLTAKSRPRGISALLRAFKVIEHQEFKDVEQMAAITWSDARVALGRVSARRSKWLSAPRLRPARPALPGRCCGTARKAQHARQAARVTASFGGLPGRVHHPAPQVLGTPLAAKKGLWLSLVLQPGTRVRVRPKAFRYASGVWAIVLRLLFSRGRCSYIFD